MSGLQSNRFLRHYGRALVVWAMMPLAILNGRTIIGCGCTGHFEEVCRCIAPGAGKTCCHSTGSCCGGHGKNACSCCSRDKSGSSPDSKKDRASDAVCRVGSRHCVTLAVHEVIPATEEPTLSSVDGHFASLGISSLDLAVSQAFSPLEPIVQLDLKCPPNDLVVTLHRFII